MCGISGIIYFDGRPTDDATLAPALAALHHRGPDGSGVWCGDGVALAHNRLAIIDTEAGVQPMATADGNAVIIYNGEMYNYKELRQELLALGHEFATSSDTEVVLKSYVQWGADCVERLRGMFAFAVWDRRLRRLFVARDRLGIKPLYYHASDTCFIFSSELQGVLAFGLIAKELDYAALDHYLHYQYVPQPLTIFRKVRALSPAHLLTVSAVQPSPTPVCYWDVRFAANKNRSFEQCLEELEHEIDESVRLHLASDVPFGAFLSGGIDSSTVVSHMSRHLPQPVQTFTIGFEEASFDEQRYAEQAARVVGAEFHLQVINPDTINLLDDLVYRLARHYGSPFADSSAIPTYFVSQMASQRVKMVLSGDGGDELFAGYNTYPAILGSQVAASTAWSRLLPASLRQRALRLLHDHAVCRRAELPPDIGLMSAHSNTYSYFNDNARQELYAPDCLHRVNATVDRHFYTELFTASRADEALSALQYLDMKTYLVGDILTKVDIASMMHSLEVRVPLLDHRVVELAARIPAAYKFKLLLRGELQKKYLLKRHAASLFPKRFFDRPKQGFGVPIGDWFSKKLKHQVTDRILKPTGILADLFRRESLELLVATPAALHHNHAKIWALLMLDAWAENYRPLLD